MRNIAIIPARSGSKGLPDKNIKRLNGKPLMAYSIICAIESGIFETIMVSTDSQYYAEIAREYGAEVPFMRTPQTASDSADSWSVVKEVLLNYEKMGESFENVCLLQPTSPLRNTKDIIEAYNVFNKEASVSVISVCEMEHPPKWCNVLPDDLSLNGFICDKGERRQCYKKYYRLNGAIYFVNIKELFKDSNLYREGSYAYVMPIERSIDIDTNMDFKLAEFFMSQYQDLGN